MFNIWRCPASLGCATTSRWSTPSSCTLGLRYLRKFEMQSIYIAIRFPSPLRFFFHQLIRKTNILACTYGHIYNLLYNWYIKKKMLFVPTIKFIFKCTNRCLGNPVYPGKEQHAQHVLNRPLLPHGHLPGQIWRWTSRFWMCSIAIIDHLIYRFIFLGSIFSLHTLLVLINGIVANN